MDVEGSDKRTFRGDPNGTKLVYSHRRHSGHLSRSGIGDRVYSVPEPGLRSGKNHPHGTLFRERVVFIQTSLQYLELYVHDGTETR